MPLPIHDPGPWIKFWWKGVDIIADVVKTVIAAGIVSIVAFLTWKWKKKREQALDLEHEKAKAIQAFELSEKLAADKEQKYRSDIISQLQASKTDFVSWASTVNADKLAEAEDLRNRYMNWLRNHHLTAFPQNDQNMIRLRVTAFSNHIDAMLMKGPLPEMFKDKRPFTPETQAKAKEVMESLVRDMERVVKVTILPESSDNNFPWHD
jgi:hypothetical protein